MLVLVLVLALPYCQSCPRNVCALALESVCECAFTPKLEFIMAWQSSGTTNEEMIDNMKRKSMCMCVVVNDISFVIVTSFIIHIEGILLTMLPRPHRLF